jgi:hypothetical protein
MSRLVSPVGGIQWQRARQVPEGSRTGLEGSAVAFGLLHSQPDPMKFLIPEKEKDTHKVTGPGEPGPDVGHSLLAVQNGRECVPGYECGRGRPGCGASTSLLSSLQQRFVHFHTKIFFCKMTVP